MLDLDPPDEAGAFGLAVQVAHLVRAALRELGLDGAVKTSGAKGVHVFVPIDDTPTPEQAAGATRAIAARVERLDPQVATTAFMKEDRGHKVFVDSTRAGTNSPDVRRMVTELLRPTTCTLVSSVSGATKNPLPRPPEASTSTIAGMTRATTVSNGTASLGAVAAGAGS